MDSNIEITFMVKYCCDVSLLDFNDSFIGLKNKINNFVKINEDKNINILNFDLILNIIKNKDKYQDLKPEYNLIDDIEYQNSKADYNFKYKDQKINPTNSNLYEELLSLLEKHKEFKDPSTMSSFISFLFNQKLGNICPLLNIYSSLYEPKCCNDWIQKNEIINKNESTSIIKFTEQCKGCGKSKYSYDIELDAENIAISIKNIEIEKEYTHNQEKEILKKNKNSIFYETIENKKILINKNALETMRWLDGIKKIQKKYKKNSQEYKDIEDVLIQINNLRNIAPAFFTKKDYLFILMDNLKNAFQKIEHLDNDNFCFTNFICKILNGTLAIPCIAYLLKSLYTFKLEGHDFWFRSTIDSTKPKNFFSELQKKLGISEQDVKEEIKIVSISI